MSLREAPLHYCGCPGVGLSVEDTWPTGLFLEVAATPSCEDRILGYLTAGTRPARRKHALPYLVHQASLRGLHPLSTSCEKRQLCRNLSLYWMRQYVPA